MSSETRAAGEQAGRTLNEELPGIERHPHAAAVLGAALAPAGAPSHAYLFHGPAGTGKRVVARAFAAALLAEGARVPDTVVERVEREAHPDLTWVRPSGAAEMLVSDVEEPVVAAAARTPFESSRRVFVIEQADAMNDQAANRMLKTLEEPPAFVHLLLLTDRREDVLPTILSRCQQVRFDARGAAQMASELAEAEGEQALACARLALGDAQLAERLAGEEGRRLRASAKEFVRSVLAGETERRPWSAMLDQAKQAGEGAGMRAADALARELELIAPRERKRYERESLESRRRTERRARTQTLDLSLRLVELWLRDVLCILEGAGELIYATDLRAELEEDAGGRDAGALREALELLAGTRLSLELNVSEELALEALAYRLAALLNVPDRTPGQVFGHMSPPS